MIIRSISTNYGKTLNKIDFFDAAATICSVTPMREMTQIVFDLRERSTAPSSRCQHPKRLLPNWGGSWPPIAFCQIEGSQGWTLDSRDALLPRGQCTRRHLPLPRLDQLGIVTNNRRVLHCCCSIDDDNSSAGSREFEVSIDRNWRAWSMRTHTNNINDTYILCIIYLSHK